MYCMKYHFLHSNVGCHGQGTSETSYLCKPCFAEQQVMRQNSTISNKNKQNQQGTHNDNVKFPGINCE